MNRPVRIQLKRTKGWRMPANTVKVDRTTKWGNPFDWRDWLENAPRSVLRTAAEREYWARQQCVAEFYERQLELKSLVPSRFEREMEELRGKNLACWCKPGAACHAEILLAFANPALPSNPVTAGGK